MLQAHLVCYGLLQGTQALKFEKILETKNSMLGVFNVTGMWLLAHSYLTEQTDICTCTNMYMHKSTNTSRCNHLYSRPHLRSYVSPTLIHNHMDYCRLFSLLSVTPLTNFEKPVTCH